MSDDFLSDPIEAAVQDYLLNDSYFQKAMRKLGFLDYSYTQRKAWTVVLKTYILDFILKKLPTSDEDGINASEIRRRMGGDYDKSNLSKYLVQLVKLGFAEAAQDENDRPTYRRSWVGDYYAKHGGYVYMPKAEFQDALTKAEEQLVKRDIDLEHLRVENAQLKADKQEMAQQLAHLIKQVKKYEEGK